MLELSLVQNLIWENGGIEQTFLTHRISSEDNGGNPFLMEEGFARCVELAFGPNALTQQCE